MLFFAYRVYGAFVAMLTLVRPCYEMAVELTPVGLGVSVGASEMTFGTSLVAHESFASIFDNFRSWKANSELVSLLVRTAVSTL